MKRTQPSAHYSIEGAMVDVCDGVRFLSCIGSVDCMKFVWKICP